MPSGALRSLSREIMDVFKRTLFRKIFLLSAGLATAGFLVVAGFFFMGYVAVPWQVVVGMTVFFAVAFGAVFRRMVSKPFDAVMHEIKAVLTGVKYNRIFTKRIDEFGVFAHFFNETVSSLEAVKQSVKEGRRMSSELDVVREIQTSILPKQVPAVPKFDVIAKNRPAAEVSGDSFDFIRKGDKQFVYIGDVTGHGAPAGMIMMMVNALIHVFSDSCATAKEILIHANSVLKPRIRTTMFMTLVMLEWDVRTNQMKYVGAGHENVLVYRAGQGICEVHQSGGIALGMVDDNSMMLNEQTVTLQPGDLIVLYTDGVSEAKNNAGAQYGVTRLKASIEKHAATGSADAIFKNLSKDLADFAGNEVQEDDVTLIVARYTGQDAMSDALTDTAWMISG